MIEKKIENNWKFVVECCIKKESPSPEQVHEFFTHTALRGAFEIRELLNISYTDVHKVELGEDARKCYFHGILKELVKAGMRHEQETVFFVKNSKHAIQKQNPLNEHFLDMMYQESKDVLALHSRKLSEILIDLIGFGQSNRIEQYQQFLIVDEIDRKIRSNKNLTNYYNCNNKSINNQIDKLKKDLFSIELKHAASASWYLKGLVA